MLFRKIPLTGHAKAESLALFGVDYDIVVKLESPEDEERLQFIYSCFFSCLHTRKEIMDYVCKVKNL